MSWLTLLRYELKAIFSHKPLLLTVFGGVLLYSFLYPLPYSNQLPRQQEIVMVNLDDSQLSRQIERMIEATPQVTITEHRYSIAAGKQLVVDNKVHGIVVIPPHFYRDLLLSQTPTIAYGGDAAYFLVYGTIVEGVAKASGTLGAQAKVSRMLMSGEPINLASNQFTPFKLNMVPVFNPTMGYIHYVVPAVFVFILHQTLLIATAMLSGEQNQAQRKGIEGYWLTASPLKLMLSRASILMAIYLLLTMFYFGFSFSYYQINQLADMAEVLMFIIPLLLSVIFFGMTIGQLIPRPELATVIGIVMSLPLIFSIGFIWPTSSIPTLINVIANFIPATPAINGLLRINQMGACFDQVVSLCIQLWGLVFIYAATSYLLITQSQKRAAAK